MRTIITLIIIIKILLCTSTQVEAGSSLFGEKILNRNSLERQIEMHNKVPNFEVRIISLSQKNSYEDTNNPKITLENLNGEKLYLKNWYIQTSHQIYYFENEYLEAKEVKSFKEIGNRQISFNQSGEEIRLYNQNSKLIHLVNTENFAISPNINLDKTTGLYTSIENSIDSKIVPAEIKNSPTLSSQKTDKLINANTNLQISNVKSPNLEHALSLQKISNDNSNQPEYFFNVNPNPLASYIMLLLLTLSSSLFIINHRKILLLNQSESLLI